MRCSHCDKEIPGIVCPGCRETIPQESRYCLYCGAMLKDESLAGDDLIGAEETDDIDFENRILCSDGNCIGIIIKGKCNICGRSYRGKKK
ncbi:MAG: zinc ribbon domain-containing protein [Deltaproteobacteria bacterium]|nr:MAG: zinc ribbon domain-containing protein [Deltaproteobacteria bacterium]